MKITCVIVDDELPARQGLAALMEEFSGIEVVETCADGIEAIDAIRSHNPDFVLLDVQMPHVNGFEVLASIPPPRPQVIFITAYDEFALKAFEVNAVDYLLKPFNDDRFAEAIARVREKVSQAREDHGITRVLNTTTSADAPQRPIDYRHGRLVLKVDGNVHLIPHAEVVFIEAYDYYIKVHVKGSYLLIRETMRNMEKLLPSDFFVRIHKSYIVNVAWVRVLTRDDHNDLVQLTTGEKLKVSRTKLSTVRQILQNQ